MSIFPFETRRLILRPLVDSDLEDLFRLYSSFEIMQYITDANRCHCAHLLIKRLLNISPMLARMQGVILTLFPHIELPGLVRVSLGIENSEGDVDTLIRVLGEIARQPRSS